MGYWSIMSSVDTLDDSSNVPVAMSADEALAAAEAATSRPGRVVVSRRGEGELQAVTVQHTPAWALGLLVMPIVGIVTTFAVRVNREATIRVVPAERGSVIQMRGRLDTRAAAALRKLAAA